MKQYPDDLGKHSKRDDAPPITQHANWDLKHSNLMSESISCIFVVKL